MSSREAEVIHRFYNLLKFYRELGWEYVETSQAVEGLRRAVQARIGKAAPTRHKQPLRHEFPPVRGHNIPRRRAASQGGGLPGDTQKSCRQGGIKGKIEALALSVCAGCPLFISGTVPICGKGPQDARLLVAGGVGDALFKGKAGDLLTKMLRAVRIDRRKTFITSAVRCRYDNDGPGAEDIVFQCGNFLLEEIMTVRPSYILAFGMEAACIILKDQNLLPSSVRPGDETGIKELRGRVISLKSPDCSLVVTHSPVSMLKLSNDTLKMYKREAWHDLQLLEKMYHG